MLSEYGNILEENREEIEEEKRRKRNRRINDYHARSLEQITIKVPKGTRQRFNSACEKAGTSARAYLLEAIERLIEEQEGREGKEEGKPSKMTE